MEPTSPATLMGHGPRPAPDTMRTDAAMPDLAAAFLRENPHFQERPPAPGRPGAYAHQTDSLRMVNAGGAFSQLIMHPTFVPFEFLARKLPEDGMFNATPENNFTFELAAFQVPQQMTFVLTYYRFSAHRLSGAAPNDSIPLEEDRLTSLMSTDVTIDRTRKSNLNIDIVPTPIQASQDAYSPNPSGGVIATGNNGTNTGAGGSGTPGIAAIALPQFAPSSGPQQATPLQFNLANFVRAAVPSGIGKSGLPMGRANQGSPNLTFAQFARSSQTMQFQVTVIGPIPIPLAFVEVNFSGVLMPANSLDEMLASMAPMTHGPGGGR